MFKRDRTTTAKDVSHELKSIDINCSRDTVQRRLHENGFFGGIKRKKPAISGTNKVKRLAFAKKYLKMPQSFWSKILWSDESKFEVTNSKRR